MAYRGGYQAADASRILAGAVKPARPCHSARVPDQQWLRTRVLLQSSSQRPMLSMVVRWSVATRVVREAGGATCAGAVEPHRVA